MAYYININPPWYVNVHLRICYIKFGIKHNKRLSYLVCWWSSFYDYAYAVCDSDWIMVHGFIGHLIDSYIRRFLECLGKLRFNTYICVTKIVEG